MPTCVNCGASYEAPVYRNTVCDNCGRELKTCRNCRHYAPGAAADCREPVSEPVLDKDRANFCDWFQPATDAAGRNSGRDSGEKAKKAFDDLFSDG